MSDLLFPAQGFYPFDENDYENRIRTNCLTILTDEYNINAGNFKIMHLNCCSLKSKYAHY